MPASDAAETFRQRQATASQRCELATLLFTAIFCAAVHHDLKQSNPRRRISSQSWLRDGFCIDENFNSHWMCFVADVCVGGMLLLINFSRFGRSPSVGLKISMMGSAFTVIHGVGHLMVGEVLQPSFLATFDFELATVSQLIVSYAIAAVGLAVGPCLGFVNGVGGYTCVVAHLISVWACLQFVPMPLVFWFIQVYLNVWYCLPRVLLLGTTEATAVSQRVDHGWALVSVGLFLAMPMTFLEMLGCDYVLQKHGGHFVHDAAILGFSVFYCKIIWEQFSGSGKSD